MVITLVSARRVKSGERPDLYKPRAFAVRHIAMFEEHTADVQLIHLTNGEAYYARVTGERLTEVLREAYAAPTKAAKK